MGPKWTNIVPVDQYWTSIGPLMDHFKWIIIDDQMRQNILLTSNAAFPVDLAMIRKA